MKYCRLKIGCRYSLKTSAHHFMVKFLAVNIPSATNDGLSQLGQHNSYCKEYF